MTENITSLQNPKVKRYLRLRDKSAARRHESVFCVEGLREIAHCLGSGYDMESLFVAPTVAHLSPADILSGRPCQEVLLVSGPVYERMALRGGTEGAVAIFKTREHGLECLTLPDNPLVVVVESVEKPGNLGAVLRSADASGVDAVIVCDPLTDLYNPNLIRSSLGAVFTVPCVACPTEDCIRFLKAKKIQILTAQLQDSRLYYDIDMNGPTAIVMGAESTGLSQAWRDAADAHIRIPMLGQLDSLNVSVSAAILMFEAVRQRNDVR
ncbi:MAG: TrmH family RNA methyltransferase [Prevotella sp.]